MTSKYDWIWNAVIIVGAGAVSALIFNGMVS